MSAERKAAKVEGRIPVTYELDEDGWWVASVPSVRGCHTQGRSIRQARSRILDALEASLGHRPDADIVDNIKLSKPLGAAVARAKKASEAATRASSELRDARLRAARQLVEDGLSVRDAAEILGLSHQRVHMIVTGD